MDLTRLCFCKMAMYSCPDREILDFHLSWSCLLLRSGGLVDASNFLDVGFQYFFVCCLGVDLWADEVLAILQAWLPVR